MSNDKDEDSLNNNNNKDDIITIHKPGNEKISENKFTKEEIKEKRMNRMVIKKIKNFFIFLTGRIFHSWHPGLYRPRSFRSDRVRSGSRLVVSGCHII